MPPADETTMKLEPAQGGHENSTPDAADNLRALLHEGATTAQIAAFLFPRSSSPSIIPSAEAGLTLPLESNIEEAAAQVRQHLLVVLENLDLGDAVEERWYLANGSE